MSESIKKLYQYQEDFGRMGTLTGRILLDDEEYNDLLDRSGTAQDVLGKHSEIDIEITPETLKLVTDDHDFLRRSEELKVDLECGFDPRGYLDEDEG